MTSDLRHSILTAIAADGSNVAARLAAQYGVSRQSGSAWLAKLKHAGLVASSGVGRGVRYRLVTLVLARQAYPRAGLQEDRVWRELILPRLGDLPGNARDIWQYAVTEMVNNAIDHSGSRRVTVDIQRDALNTTVYIADEGEGIFLKIQRALNLYDPREAILELAKGKLTTAPEQHTGEGIFFTSRALDFFEIESHHLRFSHAPRADNAIAEQAADTPGTRVCMRLANDSPRVMREVFDAYTDPEEYTFDKTVVPLRLAQYEGEKLVSRSQAKRVAHRFERFKRVELDFAGVSDIGQAFADELFRVFVAAHPTIRITPINTEPAVAQMIRRAVAAGAAKAGNGNHA